MLKVIFHVAISLPSSKNILSFSGCGKIRSLLRASWIRSVRLDKMRFVTYESKFCTGRSALKTMVSCNVKINYLIILPIGASRLLKNKFGGAPIKTDLADERCSILKSQFSEFFQIQISMIKLAQDTHAANER